MEPITKAIQVFVRLTSGKRSRGFSNRWLKVSPRSRRKFKRCPNVFSFVYCSCKGECKISKELKSRP